MPDLFSDPLSVELRRRLGDAWIVETFRTHRCSSTRFVRDQGFSSRILEATADPQRRVTAIAPWRYELWVTKS